MTTGEVSILVNPQPADLSRLLNRLQHAEALAAARLERITELEAELAALPEVRVWG